MIKWGQKSKSKKIPCWIPDPSKFSEELRGRDMRELSQIFRFVLNTQKSLLKSSYPKNTCQNFLTQKNPEIKNFKPQKISRSSRSLEIQSTPWAPVYIVYPQTLDEPVCIICFFNYRKMCCFNSPLIACQTHLFVNGPCSLSFHSLLDCNTSRV